MNKIFYVHSDEIWEHTIGDENYDCDYWLYEKCDRCEDDFEYQR